MATRRSLVPTRCWMARWWPRCGGCRSARQVVALRLLLDLDTATTAEMLGMSGSTVATHLQRAIAALRRGIPALTDQELTP
jgi:Sigma-70, region 4